MKYLYSVWRIFPKYFRSICATFGECLKSISVIFVEYMWGLTSECVDCLGSILEYLQLVLRIFVLRVSQRDKGLGNVFWSIQPGFGEYSNSY